MKAIGQIMETKSATGHYMVGLFFNDKRNAYCLSNPEEVPYNYPEWGLFEFVPEDQFCKWIDPAKL